MEATCEECGASFGAKRSTARFCSDNCRMKARYAPEQNAKPPEQALSVLSVTTGEAPTSANAKENAKNTGKHPGIKIVGAAAGLSFPSTPPSEPGYPPSPGEHVGHLIAAHNHPARPKPKDHNPPCSGRWFCDSCQLWFSSPACPGYEIPGRLMGLQPVA